MPIDRVPVRVQRTRKRCQRAPPPAAGLLSGTIEAIEELDRGDATYARLAAALLLQRPDGSVLLRHDFDETRPCPTRDPRQVVAMRSQILADQAASPGPTRGRGAAAPVAHRRRPRALRSRLSNA